MLMRPQCYGIIKFERNSHISSSRKRHKMRQRYVTSSFSHRISRCSCRVARVLVNESTEPVDNSTASIEPQSSVLIDHVYLSACPPTLKDRSIHFLLSLSLFLLLAFAQESSSVFFITASHFLSAPSPFLQLKRAL